MTPLRPGLLENRSIVLAGSVPAPVGARLASLGARLQTCGERDEDSALEWARAAGRMDALVCASGPLPSVDETWVAVRAVASAA